MMFQLRKYYYVNGFDNRTVTSFAEDQIFAKPNSSKTEEQSKPIQDKDLVKKYLKKLRMCIDKIQCQKENKIEEITMNQKKNKNKR